MTVEAPRTLDNRSPMVTIGDTVHVAAPGPGEWVSEFRDVTTRCGITSTRENHECPGHLPLRQATCPACVTAELARPFVHAISTGRRQLGTGAIKGSGMRYGSTVRCTCGWTANYNEAPSRGGKRMVEAMGAEHLADIEGANP